MAYRTLRPLNPETIWPTIKISKSEIQTITAGKGFERLLMHHKPSASAIQSEISVFCITKLTKNGFGYQVPIHDISEFSNLTRVAVDGFDLPNSFCSLQPHCDI